MKPLLIAMFLGCNLFAQSPEMQALAENYARQDQRYKPYDYQKFDQVAPWQSVRLQPYAHFQIDIRGPLSHLNAIDIALVQRDLDNVWDEYQYTSFELLDRGYTMDMHTSIPYWPIHRWFDQVWDQGDAYDPDNCPSPCNGWYMYELPNGLIYAMKHIGGDDYQVSFVRFVKWRSGPKY